MSIFGCKIVCILDKILVRFLKYISFKNQIEQVIIQLVVKKSKKLNFHQFFIFRFAFFIRPDLKMVPICKHE